MNKDEIISRSYGKWILAGEHTVLRGGPALLFPFNKFCFEIVYKKKISFSKEGSKGPHVFLGNTFQELKAQGSYYVKMIETALDFIGKSDSKNEGAFHLNSTIPRASGLGSSAAFCVCLSKIFFQLGWIKEKDILNLSHQLENKFHGKSSGADIQAVYHNKPILFRNFEDIEFINPQWTPSFHLCSTNIYSETKKCISKVEDFIKKFPDRGQKLDQQMIFSVETCLSALKTNAEDGLKLLIQGMEKAGECFYEWGLCEPEEFLNKIEKLKNDGALAVKPTGSGGGGYVVSLWKDSKHY